MVVVSKRLKTTIPFEGGNNNLVEDESIFEQTVDIPVRPEVEIKNDESVLINWMDIDMYMSPEPLRVNPRAGKPVPGATTGPVPVLRVYGVDEAGCSVIAHVWGFTPYFYCDLPPGFSEFGDENDLEMFQNTLDAMLRMQKYGAETKEIDNHVLSVGIVKRESVYGYSDHGLQEYLMIHVASPSLVNTARKILETRFQFGKYKSRNYQTFESNMTFIVRMMIDLKISGCNWIELPVGTYRELSRDEMTSTVQREFYICYNSLKSHSTSTRSGIGKFVIQSFDIECMGRKGHFPDPIHDPVIQIGNSVYVQGTSVDKISKTIFVLDGCTAITGTNVKSFKSEEEMLLAWARYTVTMDADIWTGYNIQDFDVPYLLNRAKALGISSQFSLLGKIRNDRATMKTSTFTSAAFGTRESVHTTVRGRVMMDMIQYMRRNHKMTSYSLNSVSAEFLGDQKDDVHHSEIAGLHKGNNDSRRRLAVYCMKDTLLPIRLMIKLQVLVNHVEMARVTGVPMSFLFTRGQQIKVLSMIYRKAREHNMIIPALNENEEKFDMPVEIGWDAGERDFDADASDDEYEDETLVNIPTITSMFGGKSANPSTSKRPEKKATDVGYEGATVLEPKAGFYNTPIATLDFASLYPSIMRAHNLCYTTLLSPEAAAKLTDDQKEKSPCGHWFVRASVRKGLLPTILGELLTARSQAKKDMKNAKTQFESDVMNGRQLALKVSANSVYGFTGATIGALPCVPISASVTAYGREMIEATKNFVLTRYTIANGYSADADVIYGDTDSVMVKFGVKTVAEAMKLGKEAAELVSKIFPDPVSLEFEKIYFPYLLMKKKRYAGMYWTKPDKPDKMDMKGLEAVRRDNCLLIRTMIQTCLHKILKEQDVPGAIQYVKQQVSNLLLGKVDMSMLIITKALGANYKSKQPHAFLAARMFKRDPGSAPVVGDRVPYVYIKGNKKDPGYLKTENPIYAMEHSIPLDTNYYIEKQLANPLIRLFTCLMPNPTDLFKGDHMRAMYKPTPSAEIGIVKFAVKRNRCLGCKALLDVKSPDQGLCVSCKPKRASVMMKVQGEVNEKERVFNKLWANCQRCQGSFHHEVICASSECPVFFVRAKAKKELGDLSRDLDALSF